MAPYEQGLIRVDRGLFIDKGNYHCDPRHPDFSGGVDPDGLRDSRQAFADCDAYAVANGIAGVVGPGTYKIGSNLTLSAGWDLFDGAVLRPTSGVVVTFNAQVRGWGSRAVIFDTSLGGSFVTSGGEWFFNANGFAGGALLDMGGMVKNVLAYDVEADGADATGGAMTATSAVLTRSGGTPFTSADVGKLIKVPDAGGVDTPLFSTILSYQSATQVTLANVAVATVSGKTVTFGSDQAAAIQAVQDAAVDGDTIFYPAGIYMTSADIDLETSGVNQLALGRSARIVATSANTNVFEIAAGVDDLLFDGLHIQAGGKEWAADAERELGNCIWMASTTGNRSTGVRVENCKLEDGHNGMVFRYCNYWSFVNNDVVTAHQSWTGVTQWASNYGTQAYNRIVSSHASGGYTAVEIDVAEAGADSCDFNTYTGDVIEGTWKNEGYNICGAHNTIVNPSVDVTGSAVQFLNPPGVSVSYVIQKNRVLGGSLRTTSDTFRVVGFKDLTAGHFGVNDNLVMGAEITQVGAGQGVTAEGYCARNELVDCDITGGNGAGSDAVIFTGTGNSRNKVKGGRIKGAGRYGFNGNAVAYPHLEGVEIYENANGATFASCSNLTCLNNQSHDNTTTSIVVSGPTGYVRYEGNTSENETVPSIAGIVVAFTASDATPSVKNGRRFKTANALATTITAFDDGAVGQRIWVQINDSNTTLDLTSTTLKVSGRTADYTCVSGDVVEGEFDGTNWRLKLHTAKQVYSDQATTFTGVVTVQGALTTSGVFSAAVSGESNARMLLFGGGTLWFGTGSAAQDCNWGRVGTNALGGDANTLTQLGSGAYNAGHPFFSDGHHLWLGGTEQLRIKNGTPTTATDGKRIPTMAAAQADSTAPDVATIVSNFNSLLAKLRATGVIDT